MSPPNESSPAEPSPAGERLIAAAGARGTRWSLQSSLAMGLWVALALTALRAGVLFAMERLSHETTLSFVQIRVALALPRVALVAALIGIPFGLALGATLRGARVRWLAWLLVVALFAGVWFLFLTGWWNSDSTRRVGVETDRGVQAVAALGGAAAGVALFFGLFAAWRRGRAQGSAGAPGFSRAALGIGLPLIALVGGPLVASALFTDFSDEMPIERVVYELLADEGTWTVVAERDDAPVEVGPLSPSIDYQVDGGDMPSLLMSPPATVELDLSGIGESLWLRARAGLDRSAMAKYEEKLAGHSLRYRVLRGDNVLFDGLVACERVGRFPGTEWNSVGGDRGLLVRPGDRLTLETSMVDASGATIDSPVPLTAGFGGLALEERWRVPRATASPERPNVVLIVMDTLRQDRLSAYGYSRPTSPRLDELAERGLVFENAYSTASWTWPSTASIHTGKLPQEHGVFNERSCFLSESQTTVAEGLQVQGYTTAGFSANPLIVPGKNFDQGFEVFQHGKVSTRKGELVVPEALEWLDRIGDRRFFLYLHLADPHSPLTALPEGREQFAADVPDDFDPRALDEYHWKMIGGCGGDPELMAKLDECVPPEFRQHFSDLYDACVWSGDYWLGRVLDKLSELDLDDSTVIAFTSDHGEDLFTHGFGTHGHALHGVLTKIPLVMAGPGVPRGRVDALVSNRQLAPTIAAIGQAELPGLSDPFDLREAVVKPPAGPIYFSTAQGWWNGAHRTPILGVRDENLVLHYAPEGGDWPEGAAAEGGQWRLYDLGADPSEFRDLAEERSEVAASMKAKLVEYMEELEGRQTVPVFEGGEGTLEMLRGIGYIGEDEEAPKKPPKGADSKSD